MEHNAWREVALFGGLVLGLGGAALNVYASMVLRERDREDFTALREEFRNSDLRCSGCPGRMIAPQVDARITALAEAVGDLRVAVARLERNGGGRNHDT